jgi:ubiquinone/menaquinone biosynthesis C-methylase UbiE
VGLDLSQAELQIAHTKWSASGWIRADARKMPFADDSFDCVCFSSVLHHIPDFSHALGECRRVLRPGGIVFAFDPNLLHPAMLLLRHPRSPLYMSAGVSPNERPLLPCALRKAFVGAGFVDVQCRGQSDIPYRSVAPRAIRIFLKAYNAVDWAWQHVGLGRWFGTFVVTRARKPRC